MGCEAAPKQITSVVPDIPHAPVLLPVPGRSRTSPLLHPEYGNSGFCPQGVGVSGGYDGYDGLRSGSKMGYLGCTRYTACTGYAAGSLQIADKFAPTPERSQTSGRRPARLMVLKLAFMSHQETSASADTSVR
ncbi:hypothetical protein EGV01_19880 [Pseudomonas syringae pv. theae]|nr:hypothetical protein [Pseudomonas syringae pv. theae]MBL3834882.1 hypothetical protein [Pseudomonas syringae pv. theae]MBL3874238.1 hypothetical protein [Pseudomonas syringae pv. theae]